MQLFRSISDLPTDFGPTVVSVGNFDGVHRAHQKVIAALLKRASELHARSLIVTFDPHPTRVLRPELAPKLITPVAEKLELLASAAVDAVLVLPFTHDFSKITAKEFSEILGKQLQAKEVHEGFNFHFG